MTAEFDIYSFLEDKKTLQFASGIKARAGKIWVLTSRLQNYIAGEVNVNETNYRVVMGDISKMSRGTKCQSRENWADETTPQTVPDRPPRPGSSGYYSKPLIFN